MRLRLDLGYLGTSYSGWARQPALPTIQESLEKALATTLRLEPSLVRTVVAGRTDAGVHAVGQVCHLDVPEKVNTSDHALRSLTKRVQGALRTAEISLHRISVAPEGFDARFGALSRTYEYRLADVSARKNPLLAPFTAVTPHDLNLEAMNALGNALCGLHDFASFCRPKVKATTIRTLKEFSWTRDQDGVLVARVVADAFCRSMVRSLVGSCVAVGRGKVTQERALELRDLASRTSEWATMPAKGLTLISIEYPPDAHLAQQAEETRARRLPATD